MVTLELADQLLAGIDPLGQLADGDLRLGCLEVPLCLVGLVGHAVDKIGYATEPIHYPPPCR
jgi:hypothetical protein